MRENESIWKHTGAFASLSGVSQIFSKFVLTFDFFCGIKFKRFKYIVLYVRGNVKEKSKIYPNWRNA